MKFLVVASLLVALAAAVPAADVAPAAEAAIEARGNRLQVNPRLLEG